jgi:RNA polymerase sigma-70 factor, ECF subfamily
VNQFEASKLLTECFDSWYSTLVRYAHGVTGDLTVAEDLVQEVFLRFYRGLRQGTEIEKPRAWMFCVLRHDLSKHLRAKGRETSISRSELEEVAVRQTDNSPLDDSAGISQLFDVLTTREQEVLVLRLASLKYREIASRLEISGSAVNAMLARAVKKLRKAAKERNWNPDADVAKDIRSAL